MQGDYFAYNNQFSQNGFNSAPMVCTPYGCGPYTPNVMPSNKTIDKLKKKHKSSSSSRQYDEFTSNSTDESIHLVRSRKSGDESRYETTQMLKKRSQSGTSIMKGMASQLSVPRSHSDERSISPSLINEKRKARKDRKSSSKKSYSKYDDEENFSYSDNRLIDGGYLMENQASHFHQQAGQQFYQPQMPYANQYQQYQKDPYQMQQQFYQQPGYNTAPPGAPVDYYNTSNTQNFNQSNPSQSYYQQADAYSGTQTFAPDQTQMNQNLPNGAKIVAEYFLGYLDEQQQQQYQQQQLQQQQVQQVCAPQYPQQAYQPQYEPQCPPGCVPQPQCPPGCEPEQYSDSDSKEEVEIEIWEKAKKDKKKASKESSDDFKKLSDIIDVLEKKLGNLKTDSSDPIQPIFLMPKQTEQSQPKPVYVPRNIYVPVIRPVFVPRERIIVRPQIIHVARPVLVDRPVPIQQRPLVIERDRPVPVRVETIERTEPATYQDTEAEPCVDKPGVTETTYHEFSQPQRSASAGDFTQELSSQFNYTDENEETANKNKQLVLDLLEEAERRKKSLKSKSNDSFIKQQHTSSPNQFQYDINDSSKTLEATMPYNTGYTLEVLDQRISDKFEKVDQETIKSRYGVESFQYLPSSGITAASSNEFQTSNLRSGGGSFKSLASGDVNYTSLNQADGSSVYGQNYANTSSNGNLSSILTDLAKITSANK